MIVWLDGKLLDEREARVSPFDHGLLTGDGVFETMRVYGGVPFAWTRHLARLRRSADSMGIPMPDPGGLHAGAAAVLAANSLAEARLRITITGGVAPLGSARGDLRPTTIIAAGPLGEIAPAIDVATVPWPRNERGALAGLKTTSYGENVRALAVAGERGAGEAIFANTLGDLCEGTGTNVFLVEEGAVVTPPLSAGCLDGVTRALALEACASAGILAAEEDRPLAALVAAEEAFLTSTTREVQPIARVDGRALARAPGEITARLQREFRDLVARDLDP